MLDIRFIRENPDAVKENIRKKFQDEKLPLVDEVIALDAKKRAQIDRKMRNMRFRVVFVPDASREPESVIVSVDDLAVLLYAAGEECRLRMCKPGECNACQLGQVLDRCSFVTRENRAWWEVIEAARKENDDEQL